jgi:uncharacterized cupin superfamily protein
MSQSLPTPSRPLEAVRTFIDLRRFAGQSQPAAGGPEAAGDAYLTARRCLDLPAGPVSVGLLTLGRSEGQVLGLAADEFIVLLSGRLIITADGVDISLEANQSAVIPAGRAFAWRAQVGASALFMTCAGPASARAPPLAIDEAGELAPSNPPLAELLVGPTPQCRNRTDFRSANGEFMCGVWDSTPYHRVSMPYRHYELMHLLAGAVTFQDEAGRSATFAAGDIFLVEQGAECSWLSEADVTKVFAIYRPV